MGRVTRRIALLAAVASGWLAAAWLWLTEDGLYRRAYREGLADGEDRPAQEAGA